MADNSLGDWVPVPENAPVSGSIRVPNLPIEIASAHIQATERAFAAVSQQIDRERANVVPSQEQIDAQSIALTTAGSAGKSPINSYAIGKDSGTYVLDTEFSLSTRLPSGTKVKYYFEMFPAVKSVNGAQGMQAPDVGHGLSFKSSINIAKINIPGSFPIYQTMGINDEIIEFVGCFIGEYPEGYTTSDEFVVDPYIDYRSEIARGVYETNPLLGETTLQDSAGNYVPAGLYKSLDMTNQNFRAYQESSIVRKLQLSGSVFTLTFKSKSLSNERIKALRQHVNSEESGEINDGIDLSVDGYIIGFERFIQRDDRVWYKIVFRVTNHGFDDKVTNFTLTGGSIAFSPAIERVYTEEAGRSISVTSPFSAVGPALPEQEIPSDRVDPLSQVNRESPERSIVAPLTPNNLVGAFVGGTFSETATTNSRRSDLPSRPTSLKDDPTFTAPITGTFGSN
jgi:hypothetical protein